MTVDREHRIDIYAIAQQAVVDGHITDEQLKALRWWAQGAGYARIGKILGISRDAARGRVDRARHTIARLALEQDAA